MKYLNQKGGQFGSMMHTNEPTMYGDSNIHQPILSVLTRRHTWGRCNLRVILMFCSHNQDTFHEGNENRKRTPRPILIPERLSPVG